MDHHHLALSVAVWVSFFASMLGAGIAIFAGIWSAKHPSRGFDFVASARRIRTMPIPARDDA
jgi:ABC-type dipeptide/oligopeptide/nickel transport system permease component